MFDIFSTREVAITFYLTLIILFIFLNKSTRASAIKIVKIALSRQMVISSTFLALYCVCMVIGISKLPFWNPIYIKYIIIWLLFAGFPICYNSIYAKPNDQYFKKIITDNLKLIVFVDFFMSTFTFHILWELLLQPFIVLLFIMQVRAEEKYVKIFCDFTYVILGYWIFIFTIKVGISTYLELDIVYNLVLFVIPLVFSVLYLPIAYFFALIIKYEELFTKMSLMDPKNKLIRFEHRLKVILTCNISLKKIWRFETVAIREMHISMTNDDFNKMLKNFNNTKTKCY